MIQFEPVTKDKLEIALDIVNSNSEYNRLENGNHVRTMKEVSVELLNPSTTSLLIKFGNQYIGILDYLDKNPKDQLPWLGLLMIHSRYHSRGYGKRAYLSFEDRLKEQKVSRVRLGVLKQNKKAREFWNSLGFQYYDTRQLDGNQVDCFEKVIE